MIAPRGLHDGSSFIGFRTECEGLYIRQSRFISSHIEGIVNVKVGSGSMTMTNGAWEFDSDQVHFGRVIVGLSHRGPVL